MRLSENSAIISKVPQVTLAFWLIKICATTVGETGGDAVSMSLHLGYLVATYIFLAFFVVTVVAQMVTKRFHPFAYWAVVVATTTLGTTVSDYLDRTAGLGYIKSSILLSGCVVGVLLAWHLTTGKIEFQNIIRRRDEAFYWFTILVSNTLGTALGDYVATTRNMGFERGALVFSGLIVIVALAFLFTKLPRSVLFWAAYVLTRPLGATLGDTLTKAHREGGFDLNRFGATLIIVLVMVIGVVLTEQRQAARARAASAT